MYVIERRSNGFVKFVPLLSFFEFLEMTNFECNSVSDFTREQCLVLAELCLMWPLCSLSMKMS